MYKATPARNFEPGDVEYLRCLSGEDREQSRELRSLADPGEFDHVAIEHQFEVVVEPEVPISFGRPGQGEWKATRVHPGDVVLARGPRWAGSQRRSDRRVGVVQNVLEKRLVNAGELTLGEGGGS